MKTRQMIVGYVGLFGLTALVGVLNSISGLLPAIAIKVLAVLLVVAGLGLLYLLYRLYNHFHQTYHAIQTRRYELRAREQQLQIERERWQIERSSLLLAQQHQASRIYPDAKGYLPTLIDIREDGGYQYVALPHPAHQARLSAPETVASPVSAVKPESDVPIAPLFSAMSHLIHGATKLPLCYGIAGPILGTVDDLLSMAVTGKPGRGKTTALMYYVAILLACGAEVVIWDPHGAMADLAKLNDQRLPHMPDTARVYYFDRKEDIIASLPMLEQNLQIRDDHYRQTRQTMHPHLLLADELPLLADYDEELARGTRRGEEAPSLIKIIRRYVLEARKWRCYFIGSGQSMDAEILPTRVTENLSSRIVFFSSDRRARMAGLENDAIKKYLPIIRRAGSGIMVFDCARFDEPLLGAIPMISIEDLMAFLGLAGQLDTLEEEMEELAPNPLTVHQTAQTALYKPLQGISWEDSDVLESPFSGDSDGEKNTDGKVLVFQKNGMNQPLERLDSPSDERPKQYRFTETEIIQFVAAYKVVGNIEKVLSSMKKGSGYKPHARELIAAYNLRANA